MKPRPSVRRVQNVWMFSYEYSGVAQAGGLGEAVSGLARTLSSDYDRNVTVFLPSHGRHLDPTIVQQFGLKEEPTFAASGFRTGVNTVRYKYLSGLETGKDERVNMVLVKGLDDSTSYWLDNPDLYDHELTFEKMALFARTMTTYSEYVLSMKRSEIPDLIHVNDWHMVPAGVAVKQHFLERGVVVPLIFTVHLLSRITVPWHYASADWAGIKNLRHKAKVEKDREESLTYRELWEDYAGDSIEKFGSIESDYVTSVSESYLNRDVRDYVGDIIEGKSGHIHNGCDWDYDQIKSSVLSREVDSAHSSNAIGLVQRWDLRRSLLTRDLATLDQTPLPADFDLDRKKTENQAHSFSFEDDGPLVLMTGRLSPQKGADLLLDAVPAVKKIIPESKFLLFLLPSNDSSLTDTIAAKASAHPENVRLFFGRVPSLYTLAHIAADVYAMPSRSEPFGISALEAMVTGNPVVGSNLGGISETVLDLVSHGDSGTGILFHPEDSTEIARSLISLLLVMQIDELRQRDGGSHVAPANKIPIEEIAKIARDDPTLGAKIRRNCRARVEQTFRWRNAGKIALERYVAAQALAKKEIMNESGRFR